MVSGKTNYFCAYDDNAKTTEELVTLFSNKKLLTNGFGYESVVNCDGITIIKEVKHEN